jgi:hypothetical protein
MNRLLRKDYEEFTGITEETWYDEDAGTITLRRYQDVEHILERNQIMFNEHTGKPKFNDIKGDTGMYHKARIPFMIIEKWLREDGFDWYKSSDAERRAKLNDGDNKKLLVRPGRL